jgi:hypothetical protein
MRPADRGKQQQIRSKSNFGLFHRAVQPPQDFHRLLQMGFEKNSECLPQFAASQVVSDSSD